MRWSKPRNSEGKHSVCSLLPVFGLPVVGAVLQSELLGKKVVMRLSKHPLLQTPKARLSNTLPLAGGV